MHTFVSCYPSVNAVCISKVRNNDIYLYCLHLVVRVCRARTFLFLTTDAKAKNVLSLGCVCVSVDMCTCVSVCGQADYLIFTQLF